MRSLLKSGLRRLVGETAAPARPRRALGGRKAVVIAVAAQKGGVGKTTTTVNLAAALARFHGRRVLVVDLDPQGHVSAALGNLVRAGGGSLGDLLTGNSGAEVMDIATSTGIPNLEVTPLDGQLAAAEAMLHSRIGKEMALREALVATRTWYDLILVDCPPHLGNLTLNGLVAADLVLIPCDPSPLAVSGVHAIIETIGAVGARLNPDIDVLGVLMTRVDGRNSTLNEAMMAEIEGAWPQSLLDVRIGVATSLAQAQQAGLDIFGHDPEGRAAAQYRALGERVVALLEERAGA
jgi:chromosome partitioning protein